MLNAKSVRQPPREISLELEVENNSDSSTEDSFELASTDETPAARLEPNLPVANPFTPDQLSAIQAMFQYTVQQMLQQMSPAPSTPQPAR